MSGRGGGRGSTSGGRGGRGHGFVGNSTAQTNSAPSATANNVAPSNDNNNVINGDGATSNDTSRQSRALGRIEDVAGRICLSDHANGLIGLLQLTKGTQPGGIHAALGHSNQTNWICLKIMALFSLGGPLERFKSVIPNVLMQHLREAESVAKAHYQTQHSNDRLGASQKVIPQWAVEFFDLFSAASSEANNSAQVAAALNEHWGVAGSLAGQ